MIIRPRRLVLIPLPPGAEDEVKPLFDSLDEMCEAFGFDDATKEQIRRDMELTTPLAPGDPVH